MRDAASLRRPSAAIGRNFQDFSPEPRGAGWLERQQILNAAWVLLMHVG